MQLPFIMNKHFYPFLLTFLLIQTLAVRAQVNRITLRDAPDKNMYNQPLYASANGNTNSLTLHISIDELLWKETATPTGKTFTQLWVKKGYATGSIGTPKLPAIKKLIRLPRGAKATVKILRKTERELKLDDYGIKNPLIPVQPSVKKSSDSLTQPFRIDEKAYLKQTYNNRPIAKIEVLGTLRQYTIARLTVTPFDYNPGINSLKVYNDIDIQLDISPSTNNQSITDDALRSPYFDIISQSMLNAGSSTYNEHPDLTKYPVKMLIISHRMFEEALKPFIYWKTQKGFTVDVRYTDDIGTTSEAIQTFIRNYYESATSDDPAPTFLVLVGDVEQVPASATGSQSGKKTDLYYASTDGDMFPEIYYGRLSATSPDELSAIIDKIIDYENYRFANPSLLNKATLIAGEDNTWNPKIAQPTIKYGTANHFNSSKGWSEIFEYGVSSDPNNASAHSDYEGCYEQDKIAVGFINYTAHCNETGWSGPSLPASQVSTFNNLNQYPFIIANCCLSANFGYSQCVGETWLRAPKRGAVTYIGSSPSSYWYEDMYWAVGAFPMVGDNNGYVPTYDESTTGGYDAPYAGDYVTAGAIVFCGNLAVTQAEINSYPQQINPTYYWEAYNVLGDPSLIPFFTSASTNVVSHPDTIPLGSSTVRVSAFERSYIAISKDTVLLGASHFAETGEYDIPVTPIDQPGKYIITITRPQTVPYIDTVMAVVVDGPWVSLENSYISDSLGNKNGRADYNERIAVNLIVKNLGTSPANNIQVKLTGKSEYATLIGTDSISFKTLQPAPNNIDTIKNAFTFDIVPDAPDGKYLYYTLHFYSDDNKWKSTLKLQLNGPVIKVDEPVIDDSATGNNDGLISAGESLHIKFKVTNAGHSKVDDLATYIVIPDSLSNYLLVNYPCHSGTVLEPGSDTLLAPMLSVHPDYPYETLTITVITSSKHPGAATRTTYNIPVNTPRFIKMDNQTVAVCDAVFTDSGGSLGKYNDNEHSVLTILSAENSKLILDFELFDLEQGYDYLYIYDGPTTSAPQFHGSPFSGYNKPPLLTSSGNSITFLFISDKSTVQEGWKAQVSCFRPSEVPNCVIMPNPAINATDVSTSSLSWFNSPNAEYYDVFLGQTPNNLGYMGRVNTNSIPVELFSNTTYYWKVIPGNSIGSANADCATWTFTTASIARIITITQNDSYIDSCYFYDSGGELSGYSNLEDDTLTVYPRVAEGKIKISFEQFEIEHEQNCQYDYLNIYDGPDTDSPLVGTYCGSTVPSDIVSTHPSGALTFVFHSDRSSTYSGWKAKLTTIENATRYPVTIKVTGNESPITSATVNLDGILSTTIWDGTASYFLSNRTYTFTVTASGYAAYTGTLTVNNSKLTKEISLEPEVEVDVSVYDSNDESSLSGAKVTLGNYESYTSAYGNTRIRSKLGEIPLGVSLEGYHSFSNIQTIISDNQTISVPLNKRIFSASIRVVDNNHTPLEGATVRLGNETATTDSEGKATLTVPWGNHELSASLAGYIMARKWVRVENSMADSLMLNPIPAGSYETDFTIYGKTPTRIYPLGSAIISVLLEGTNIFCITTNTAGMANVYLPANSYTYHVTAEGYQPLEKIPLTITDKGQAVTDTIHINTYSVRFNVISNNIPVSNATVTLDGYVPSFTDYDGVAIIEPVTYSNMLSYTISKSGYATSIGMLEVKSDKMITVNLSPLDTPQTTETVLQLFPNPTSGKFFLLSEITILRIEIYNQLGKLVHSEQPRISGRIPVDITTLPRGLYLVRAIVPNKPARIFKIIKYTR